MVKRLNILHSLRIYLGQGAFLIDELIFLIIPQRWSTLGDDRP